MQIDITGGDGYNTVALDAIASWADTMDYPILVSIDSKGIWANNAWVAAEWNKIKGKELHDALANS